MPERKPNTGGEQRRPTLGFWMTLALVVLLLSYPLSFGPACWLVGRERMDPKEAASFYRPFVVLTQRGPKFVKELIWSYAELDDYGASGLHEMTRPPHFGTFYLGGQVGARTRN